MIRIGTALPLGVRALASRLRVGAAERRVHRTEVELAIERLVDQANPALRGLSRYRRRLFPVAERLLAYSHQLVGQIPGPVLVNAEQWSADPLVNALFGNIERIRQVVSGPAVRAWAKVHPDAQTTELYALLVAVPEERAVLGTELVGDHVQRDVRQETLGFRDHALHAVGDSMEAVRAALVQQAAALIASIAIAGLVEQEERIAALEQALTMLRLKLKVVNPRAEGLDLLLQGSSLHLQEQARLNARIAETERELADARGGLGNIDEYLERLIGLLSHPEQDITLEPMNRWLDRMNIVRTTGAENAREVCLMRARRRDQPGRIAQFIRFPRDLIMSVDERLAQVERQLGMTGAD